MAKMRISTSNLTVALGAIGFLLIAGAVLWLTRANKDIIPSTQPNQSKAGQAGTPTSNQKGQSNAGNSGASETKNTAPQAASDTALIAPSGTFVSNHHPSLGAGPAPSTEQSVCNTTVGAQCYIEFTKDGLTKKLQTETVDSTGASYWDWDVSKAGLSSGSWRITAVATLNGQTKSTADQLNLEVSP